MSAPRNAQTRRTRTPVEVALAFIARINAHDERGLSKLMTERHLFIDAVGGRFEGRENMQVGWREFFRLFPDYRIEVTDTLSTSEIVGIFGNASGSYHDAPKKRWHVAAAWKAVISDGLVAEWCVYCDTTWARRER